MWSLPDSEPVLVAKDFDVAKAQAEQGWDILKNFDKLATCSKRLCRKPLGKTLEL